MTTTGLVYHSAYLNHDTGTYHPECPTRLRSVLSGLDRSGLRAELTAISPAEVAPVWLEKVHTPRHLSQVQRAVLMADLSPVHLDQDTPVSGGSGEAASRAAGGVIAALDRVADGRVDNAFCLVRPPGHHAEPDRVMGFCLYNSVAVAARYAQQALGLHKVLIIDWDVHHGNGTQAAFWNDPGVFYCSTHQYPHYPGSGAADDIGEGDGLGTTLNLPLAAGAGDREMLDALERQLLPAAAAFGPDVILISAGFDAHQADPLAHLCVTTDGFARLTELALDLAQRLCGGRLVSVLEGGYDLDALADSVHAHLAVLSGHSASGMTGVH